MAKLPWKLSKDPLFRGDSSKEICTPSPAANKSIVRHILYLEGQGRLTPYLSTSELRETAARFAGKNGAIFAAKPKDWDKHGVKHRAKKELLQLLRGKGKGDAQWHSAYDVLKAHQYVEEHLEHLADFSETPSSSPSELKNTLNKAFSIE